MDRRSFLKICAATLGVVATPVIAKGLREDELIPQMEVGRFEGFRFVETATFWDSSKEYGIALPYRDYRSMLWAAVYLKRHADDHVPPFGMAELRTSLGTPPWSERGLALYWSPSPDMQLAKPERHLEPLVNARGGYGLLERFSRE